jgi:hypothetical protein
MADDVHVHQAPGSGGGMGWVAAVIAVVVLLLVVWFLFAGGAADDGGTTIEVPEEIDVNIETPSGGGQGSP